MDPLRESYISPLAAFYMSLRAEAPGGAAPAQTTPPPATGEGGGGEGGGSGGEGAAPANGGGGSGSPAGGEGGGGQGGGGQGGGQVEDPANWDKDRAARTITHLRDREKELERQAAEEKRKREELEREKMSEEERKEADRKKTEEENAQLKQRVNSAELLGTLAARDDVADAEIARDLLIQRGLKFGDDGKPVDLDQAVTNLLEAKPVLKKDGGSAPAPAPGGSGGGSAPPATNGGAGSGGQGPSPQLSADEVEAANKAGMSPERFAAMKGGMSLAEWEEQQRSDNNGGGGN